MPVTFDNPIDSLDVISAGAIAVGSARTIGTSQTTACVGVAMKAAAGAGEVVPHRIRGLVRDLTSDTGTAWANGDRIYWNGTLFTKTAASNCFAGLSYGIKASGSALCAVLLSPPGA